MGKKKEKGFWVKKTESFSEMSIAKERAARLREHGKDNVGHVVVTPRENDVAVGFSVSKLYMDTLDKAGLSL